MPSRLGMLRKWHAAGILRDIDRYAAATALRVCGGTAVEAAAMALASRAVGDGHVCLDLAAVTEAWLCSLLPDPAVPLPEGSAAIAAAIRALPDAENHHFGQSTTVAGVFVLAGRRLYLRRFYDDERFIERRLVEMAADQGDGGLSSELESQLQRAFPGSNRPQQVAARHALTRQLTLITGGPGTGKTYTAARILALLSYQHEWRRPLRVRLSAPTGKAASRLGESIRQARAAMPAATFAETMMVDEACTLDRLLGRSRQTATCRYHAGCPLEADVVMVDEASMVDLAKMARLLEAMPPRARLVLLGDRHQLAAVAPGSVLAAICNASALSSAVVELTESRRFAPDSGVARFSAAVNTATDADAAAQAIKLLATPDPTLPDHKVRFVESPVMLKTWRGGVDVHFAQHVLRGYRDFLDARTPAAAFDALASFRVLCALRRGPLGVETINPLIEEILSLQGLTADHCPPDCKPTNALQPTGPFYSHRVVMISQNDYSTGLFNGDVGIVLPMEEAPERLTVYFEQPVNDQGERIRAIPCHLLPAHETAFAITVHKSQGSEFGHVLVLLPPVDSPVVTRELIYTAVTRTRSSVSLWGGRESLTAAMQRSVRRFSGLFAGI